jgi:hypothetical protein
MWRKRKEAARSAVVTIMLISVSNCYLMRDCATLAVLLLLLVNLLFFLLHISLLSRFGSMKQKRTEEGGREEGNVHKQRRQDDEK